MALLIWTELLELQSDMLQPTITVIMRTLQRNVKQCLERFCFHSQKKSGTYADFGQFLGACELSQTAIFDLST